VLRELRTTLVLAVPITVGHLGNILLQLTDTVMIGRLGAVPLAGAAFAGTIFGFIYVTSLGLLTAVSVRAAFAHGAGRPREAGEVLRHGLFLAAIESLVCGAGIQWLSHHLEWFGQPPEVARAAQPFLALIGWSLAPSLLFLALKNYYEALNRPWMPMAWVFAGLAVNVFFNWVLLYGNLGAPALGLIGSGWASLISRTVILGGLVLHLVFSRELAHAHPERWAANPVFSEFRAQLALGLPVSFQLLFEVGLFTAAALLMGWLGTIPLAAHQVALSCASATFMFPLGISIALSVRIGQVRGAGEGHRLRAIGLGGIGTGAAIMSCFALVFVAFGRSIAACFIADPVVIDLATRLLVVAAIFQLFDGTQVTSSGALRGLADVRGPTLITFVGYWLLALPAAWTLGFPGGYGPVGVWTGLALGLAICAVLLLGRFVHKTRPAD
jgi:MATE family multidrug resistance protein